MKTRLPMLLAGLVLLLVAVPTGANGAEKVVVGLDRYYNNEIRDGKPYHYAWEDTRSYGYSQLGDLIRMLGAKTTSVRGPASKESLDKVGIYIIVDPDTPKETKEPNYIQDDEIDAIVAWVKGGGMLMLMHNDKGNAEFEHMNKLANRFGITFNEDTCSSVDVADPQKMQMHSFPDHPIFNGVKKLYMYAICTLSVKQPAKELYNFRGKTIMATCRYGKGMVFAVGDPWGYNEYLPDEDNVRCLSNLFRWLITEVKSVERGSPSVETLNAKADGYRSLWYAEGGWYSGGFGLVFAKHKPLAVYCDKAKKTFFCYGGTTKQSNTRLLVMASYYDHETGMVPRPTIVIDRNTNDAHNNPVISVDDNGYVWVFSNAHGTARPAYIHRSKRPYNIDEFELVPTTRVKDGENVPMTNFSYMQSWYIPGKGFQAFFTHYSDPVGRTNFFMTSADGVEWSQWIRLAAIPVGHYQMSAATKNKAASAFNFHQYRKGTFCRTNLYYMETTDGGKTWQAAGGEKLTLPLTQVKNPAIVYDYHAESVDVYLNDMQFDRQGFPVLLYVTTEYHPCYPSQNTSWGPKDCPRRWTTARWTGTKWDIRPAMASDNNFDMGSIYIEDDGTWRIIGPTETGPQPWCTGGEVAMWTSNDQGKTWKKIKQLTSNSKYNHGWVRRPVNAHPDFYAIWADGHGVDATAVTNVPTEGESQCNLYFCDKQGNTRVLPREMKVDFAKPRTLN